MKKIIFLLVLLSKIAYAKEGVLDSYWMDGSVNDKSAETANLDSIDNFITNITESDLDALDSVKFPQDKAGDKPKWYFAGMETSLALGFSGQIGVLTFGGTKALEVRWERKKPEPKDKSNEEAGSSSIETVVVNEGTSKADLNKELEPFIRSVVDSKKVTNEDTLRKELKAASGNFLAYVKGMNAAPVRYKFFPARIRLDFNIEGSGKIITSIPVVTGKITVPVKLRLEFIRVMPKAPVGPTAVPKSDDQSIVTPDMNETEKKIATQTKSLMDKLAQEVTLAYSEQVKDGDMEKRNLELKYIEVGLGMGVEGKLGLANFKASVVPSVFFAKSAIPTATPIVDKSTDEESIAILFDEPTTDKSLGDHVMELERRKVRKGMKKALDFAFKFADKIQKKAESKKSSNWKFSYLESKYNFSLGGTVGPVKLTGLPHFILHVVNNAK